jgi:hypothetical protein
MKSKNLSLNFWTRWLAVAILHTLLFSWIWTLYPINNRPLTLALYELALGLVLNIFQYWAIPSPLRPNMQKWLLSALLCHLISRTILYFFYDGTIVLSYELGLIISYLPLAIAHSWALSERYHKAWIYGIAIGLAVLFQLSILGRFVPSDPSQSYIYLTVVETVKAIIMGLGLFILMKYFFKEAPVLSAS